MWIKWMKLDKSGKLWMKIFALLHASLIPSTRLPGQGPQPKRGNHSNWQNSQTGEKTVRPSLKGSQVKRYIGIDPIQTTKDPSKSFLDQAR